MVEMTAPHDLRPVGHVESDLVDPGSAPKQGFEGAPAAWLVFDPGLAEAVRDLEAVHGTPVLDVKPVLDGGR
jgi:tRNA (Thr-GGU) A37 N-methylase